MSVCGNCQRETPKIEVFDSKKDPRQWCKSCQTAFEIGKQAEESAQRRRGVISDAIDTIQLALDDGELDLSQRSRINDIMNKIIIKMGK